MSLSKANVTRLQQFTIERTSRSAFLPHPKNPRTISGESYKRLKDKLTTVGMMQPIVVNRRTGFVLSGHQRLSIMDKEERYSKDTQVNDYELDVAFVDVDEKVEKEVMVFFNNPAAMGDWDKDILADLHLSFGIDFEQMGFDANDVDMLFDGDARFGTFFEDDEDVKKTKKTLKEIKEERQLAKERMEEKAQGDVYFVVVCRDEEDKSDTMRRLGIPDYEQFVSSDAVHGAVERAALRGDAYLKETAPVARAVEAVDPFDATGE